MLADASILRVAVAYLTGAGVEALRTILKRSGHPPTLQFVVRATHTVASAGDLRALEQSLGGEVRAFVGTDARRFHPKMYMALGPSATWMLTGSGNLTSGGLFENQEQFELLRMHSGALMRGTNPPAKFESVAGIDIVRRWGRWWDAALPLSSALAHPAFLAWQDTAEHRAELEQARRRIEKGVEQMQPDDDGDAPVGLNTSREATEQKVRMRLEKWFPNENIRRQVYELIADAINECRNLNPEGWWCGYVTDGGQGDNRITVCARNAQVLVAHESGEVYFNAPPASEDQEAFDLCLSLSRVAGVRVTPSVKGAPWGQSLIHPYAEVPASSLAQALDGGAAHLIGAVARWRMVDGRASHWGVHSPAVVRAVAKATERSVHQPSYEP